MKTIRILSLNLWNYNHWNKRKPNIVRFINKENPDIIFFQEVRDDTEFNKKGNNQAKQLNKMLGYPSYAFYSVTNKRKENPEKYKHYCREGIAILSKFPIIKTERTELKKHPDDRHICGNLHVRMNVGKIIDLICVHFSNNDLFSKLHLIETMKQIRKKNIHPILAGDFNMWRTDWLTKLTGTKYTNSFLYKKYISYPARKWALDYVVIPKEYRFTSFKCAGSLSDHKALVAEIQI